MPVQVAEMNRLRNSLEQMDRRRQQLEETNDVPFVIFLTERMLADIEACRKSCTEMKKYAGWPSLN